jgi:O-antigen/teichoic acid export membrane protein
MTSDGTVVGNDANARDNWRKQEVGLAVTNAIKLGGSLLLTWSIALITRLYVPRYLGPARFGALNFAEAFATTAFVFLGLGLDTYVRKEISVRPKHASDFIGGVFTLRIVLMLLVFAGIELVLRSTGCSQETKQLVYIFGIGQFFMAGSNTSSGLLHATGKVDGMSIVSVLVKIVWAASIFAAILFRLNLWAFALVFTAAEAMKAIVFFWLAKNHLKFEFRVHWKSTGAVLIAALPFFVSGLATTIYDKIGVSMLEFMTNPKEVGWYGAANGLAGLVLMLVPLLSWIIVPLFARSAAQSEEELFRMIRRSLEFILLVTMPVAMILMVGADEWVKILFGSAFAPGALALRVLAATTFLMYLSIVAVYALAVLNHTWSMSFLFLSGTVINPACNLFLIPRFSAHGIPGAAGAACATATLITEIVMVTGLLGRLGRRSFDERLVRVVTKSFGVSIAVIAIDHFILKSIGPIRLVIDLALDVVLLIISRAVDPAEVIQFAREMILQRRSAKGGASNHA